MRQRVHAFYDPDRPERGVFYSFAGPAVPVGRPRAVWAHRVAGHHSTFKETAQAIGRRQQRQFTRGDER